MLFSTSQTELLTMQNTAQSSDKGLCVPCTPCSQSKFSFSAVNMPACFTTAPTPSCLSFRKSESIVPCSFLKVGSFWFRNFGARGSTSRIQQSKTASKWQSVLGGYGFPSVLLASTMNSGKHQQSTYSESTAKGTFVNFVLGTRVMRLDPRLKCLHSPHSIFQSVHRHKSLGKNCNLFLGYSL